MSATVLITLGVFRAASVAQDEMFGRSLSGGWTFYTPYSTTTTGGGGALTTPADFALVIRGSMEAGFPMLVAWVLLRVQRPLVRWLAPMPKADCPGCGYPLEGTPVVRCPECSAVLDAPMFAPPRSPATPAA